MSRYMKRFAVVSLPQDHKVYFFGKIIKVLISCYFLLPLLAQLSALTTLDRILERFRKLAAVNKTRDILYFKVRQCTY